MARNASGTYTLASGNPVVAGATIQSSWANSTLTDIANALTDSLSRSGLGGMSVPLVGVQGTAAAPAFTFVGDLGTGIYRAAASTLGFAAGGLGRMALGTTGNLALGGVTLSPGTTLALTRNLVGPVIGFGLLHDSIIQSDVTGTANLFMTQSRTAAAVFTLSQLNHFRAAQVSIGAGSTVTEQNGFLADATMIGAGVNIGFRGAIPAAANRWNLYMDGTAINHLAGELRVGTITAGGSLANSVPVVGGRFYTLESFAASVPSGVLTNIALLPNVLFGTWLISIAISAGDAANYSSFMLVGSQGTTSRVITLSSGALLAVSMSGLNVQVNQTSGVAARVDFTITRVM